MHTAARRATRRRAAFEGEGTFVTESTEQTTPTNGGGLASLKLAQLQALAERFLFKKGGVAWLEGRPRPGEVVLRAFLPPKVFRI